MVTLRDAKLWNASDTLSQHDLHVGEVIRDASRRDALAVSLEGYTIFPGLINAHDHLELNHYPRTKFRERYHNAHQWGEDVSRHLDQEPFRHLRAVPLSDRCFIGGLKNLLCGALTVAHHNPPHKCLFQRDFPVRVLRRYGWAHSLHFSTDADIVRSYRATPAHTPWFIHLAEGTDDVAAGEYRRLKALGCVGRNTVLIHGVGMTDEDIADAAKRVRGLVVCPTTNDYLLGDVHHSIARRWHTAGGRLAWGSDSRLTAAGDLLAEMEPLIFPLVDFSGAARDWEMSFRFHEVVNFQIWMHGARLHLSTAHVLGVEALSRLQPGAPADIVVVAGGHSPTADLRNYRDVLAQRRADLALVMRVGVPQIGDPDVMAKFTDVQTVPALLDGVPKRVHLRLARQVARCSLQEPGFELDPDFLRDQRRHLRTW